MNDIEDSNSVVERHKYNPFYDNYKYTLELTNKKIEIREIVKGDLVTDTFKKRDDKRVMGKFAVNEDIFLQRWAALSRSSMILVMYILKELRSGEDKIYMTASMVSAATGMDQASYYKARTQLLKEGWIANHSLLKTYFINLSFFCKGNTISPYIREETIKIQEIMHKKEIYR